MVPAQTARSAKGMKEGTEQGGWSGSMPCTSSRTSSSFQPCVLSSLRDYRDRAERSARGSPRHRAAVAEGILTLIARSAMLSE